MMEIRTGGPGCFYGLASPEDNISVFLSTWHLLGRGETRIGIMNSKFGEQGLFFSRINSLGSKIVVANSVHQMEPWR